MSKEQKLANSIDLINLIPDFTHARSRADDVMRKGIVDREDPLVVLARAELHYSSALAHAAEKLGVKIPIYTEAQGKAIIDVLFTESAE